MKKILITGKDSYIGTSFEKWVSQWPDKYKVTTIDVRDDSWKSHDFSQYDTVFHVAAIVHVKEKNKDLYYKVNRDLAYDIAKKSKASGVRFFIFMSTMGVYGINSGVINKSTKTLPKTSYSESKFEAENLIMNLKNDMFKIAVLRPPLVYGYNCKGNYRSLSTFARKILIFPNLNNKRSMIFIDNLSNYIKSIIDVKLDGILLPQNKDYVNVSCLIKKIGEVHNRKIILTNILNIVKLFKFINTFKKVFGDFYYSRELYSSLEWEILASANIIDFETSVVLSEGNL